MHFDQREEQWNKWKNDGCPEVTKRLHTNDQSDMPTPKRRLRKNLGDVIKNMTADNKVFLGEYVFNLVILFCHLAINNIYYVNNCNFIYFEEN